MPRNKSLSTPALTHQKARGRGVVRLNGHDFYLCKSGEWPRHQKQAPAAVEAAYNALISRWLAGGRRPLHAQPAAPAGPPKTRVSIAELVLAFMQHARVYYRRTHDGSQTGEADGFRLSLRPMREMFGKTPAADFTPDHLKAVREKMVAAGLSRKVVNQRVARIKAFFGWVADEWAKADEKKELTAVYGLLLAVKPLKAGRCLAPERPKVEPVDDAVVDATLPQLGRVVRAMVKLQRLTGMRPGEVCRLHRDHLDTSGPVWWFSPRWHKNAWREDHTRVIGIGPAAQEVLREFLTDDVTGWVFSPRQAVAEFRAAQRAKSGNARKPGKRKPRLVPGDRYTTGTYRVAVARGAKRAGVPHWHVNQLRHTFATVIRKRYGLEHVRVALGHASTATSEIYAERDKALAGVVAETMG